jgi:hypothetical protein
MKTRLVISVPAWSPGVLTASPTKPPSASVSALIICTSSPWLTRR